MDNFQKYSEVFGLTESIKYNNQQIQELLKDSSNPDAIAKAANLTQVIAARTGALEFLFREKA